MFGINFDFWRKSYELFAIVKCLIFCSSNPWIHIRFDLKCWIRNHIETNADPKYWCCRISRHTQPHFWVLDVGFIPGTGLYSWGWSLYLGLVFIPGVGLYTWGWSFYLGLVCIPGVGLWSLKRGLVFKPGVSLYLGLVFICMRPSSSAKSSSFLLRSSLSPSSSLLLSPVSSSSSWKNIIQGCGCADGLDLDLMMFVDHSGSRKTKKA